MENIFVFNIPFCIDISTCAAYCCFNKYTFCINNVVHIFVDSTIRRVEWIILFPHRYILHPGASAHTTRRGGGKCPPHWDIICYKCPPPPGEATVEPNMSLPGLAIMVNFTENWPNFVIIHAFPPDFLTITFWVHFHQFLKKLKKNTSIYI